jgi:hypothetical protein
MKHMKTLEILTISCLFATVSFGQEKTSNSERTRKSELTTSQDTLKAQHPTERTLQVAPATREAQPKQQPIRNERAVRVDD